MKQYKILSVHQAPVGLEAWYEWDDEWQVEAGDTTTDLRYREDGKRFEVDAVHFVALVEESGGRRSLRGLELCEGTFTVCDEATNFVGLFFAGNFPTCLKQG